VQGAQLQLLGGCLQGWPTGREQHDECEGRECSDSDGDCQQACGVSTFKVVTCGSEMACGIASALVM
jgi:hypothetical protein